MELAPTVIQTTILVVTVVIASTVHEYAHAWSADRLGDPTPRNRGRLTLNPLKHIDPIGALFLILFRFGWSKPVMVNPRNFERPVIDNAIVAAAGPFSNLMLILLTILPLKLIQPVNPALFETLALIAQPFLMINVVLMLFNLFPIPPLDGSRIIKVLMPKSAQIFWENLDRFGFILLLPLILWFSPLNDLLFNVLESGISFVNEVLLGVNIGYI